jgi:hypothetical protein
LEQRESIVPEDGKDRLKTSSGGYHGRNQGKNEQVKSLPALEIQPMLHGYIKFTIYWYIHIIYMIAIPEIYVVAFNTLDNNICI